VKDAQAPGTESFGTSRRTLLMSFRGGAATAVLSLAFNLALLPIVLGTLGSRTYGAWAAVVALIAVGSLADVGVRTEVVRRVATANGRVDMPGLVRTAHEGVTIMLVVVLPVTAAGLLVTPSISSAIFPEGVPGYTADEIHLLMRILLVAMALNLVLGAFFASLKGVQRGDIEAKAQMLALPINAAVTVLAIWAGWGLWALVVAYLAGSFTVHIAQWFALRRILPRLTLRLVRLTPTAAAAYLSLSGLALLSQVGDVLDSQWDKLVLARYVGVEAVTAFHVGTTLVLQAKALALLPLAPLMVAIAELQGSDPRRSGELQRNLMKMGMVAASVVLGGVFIFAPSFIELWLGGNYDSSGDVARVFTLAVLLNLISAPIAFQAFAEGLHRVAALAAATNILVNAILSLIWTIQIGLLGAVYGSVAGNLVGTLLFLVIVRRRVQQWNPPPMMAVLVTTGLVALMVSAGWDAFQSWWTLGTSICGFAIVVAVCGAIAERLPVRALLRGTT
jgi:O-antigen/teichoic acid export membrane protein